jgi:hypothetical protein
VLCLGARLELLEPLLDISRMLAPPAVGGNTATEQATARFVINRLTSMVLFSAAVPVRVVTV